jgi:hypothetical protein
MFMDGLIKINLIIPEEGIGSMWKILKTILLIPSWEGCRGGYG